jgi:dolichyl-phosphate-mannose--protein O-mannosyl transferase
MPPLKKSVKQTFSWFSIGLIGLLILSLALRFWGLGRFNALVFDEVYYAKFAHNYLSQIPFFDGHPPLSKYLIAFGMGLGRQMHFGQNVQNGLAGGLFAPWTYRWLNALTGSFIPLVIAAIAYQLSCRPSLAFIAGLFAALDGLFLVESRYALNNVYLILFGLLGLWTLLLALDNPRAWPRNGWLLLSGISFGASFSIKWNGLWFLLGAYGLWITAQVFQWLNFGPRFKGNPGQFRAPGKTEETSAPNPPPVGTLAERERNQEFSHPSNRLARLKKWQVFLYLGLVPVITYIVEWIPHLHLNAKAGFWPDFWELQVQILQYHEQVGNGPKIHPYCSNWFSWLFMGRPVAYFYKITGLGDPLPTGTTPLSTMPNKVIYDVHAMGNPFLWWFSSLAILLVLILLAKKVVQFITRLNVLGKLFTSSASSSTVQLSSDRAFSTHEQWLMMFVAVNYLANLLPWMRVTRCTFIYHYMGASVFSLIAIAWLVDRWIHSSRSLLRQIGFAIIAIIISSFIFWLPIYLGLPLSPESFKLRMWFPSWI